MTRKPVLLSFVRFRFVKFTGIADDCKMPALCVILLNRNVVTMTFCNTTIVEFNPFAVSLGVNYKQPVLAATTDLASDEVRWWFQTINFAVICELLSVLGSVGNIINIICFVKQGFKNSINVSLLGLAISDLGCLATLIFLTLCFNELFRQADLPFEPTEFQYMTAGWPHVFFARVTSWITAFITLERCLCVTIPLKVKSLITSKRVALIVVIIFTIVLATISPIYYANILAFKFYPGRNKTLIGLIVISGRESVEKVVFVITNMIVPYSAFLVVIVCTITLVVKLHHNTKWRQQSTTLGKSETMSSRDQKVAKMIVMISTLFIICFTPLTIIFIAMTIWPEYSINGGYLNIFLIISSFAFIMESINSSMNIFIYYHMSSKYKTAFRQLFRLDNGSRAGSDSD